MTTYETYPRRIRALSFFTMADEGVSGYPVAPGDVIDISAQMFENTRDTQGRSWLQLTPAEQRAAYGSERFEVLLP
ncbi:hypothetical protein FHS07_002353 [Microbacterium proteolyticum]|uniref:Uncharacterized protein n=1 Tax=Microbacterium proteolyticum TaxID=1572644 RepID=A0A7W5CJ56_9MICO|nr:hypothetical protein [Microbacterium proteolyticum]MBB3158657.1 hypothetical protein [Microbacterium proteolyticum]